MAIVVPFPQKFSFLEGDQLNFFTDRNTGMAVFSMDDLGPEVLYHDLKKLIHNRFSDDELSLNLKRLSVHTIVTFGQGHDYNVGVFDFPSSFLPEFRMMLIAFRLKNPITKDPRLKNGYYQIALFVPKTLLQFLPSYVFFEREMLDLVSSLTSSGKFTKKRFELLKREILQFLNAFSQSF